MLFPVHFGIVFAFCKISDARNFQQPLGVGQCIRKLVQVLPLLTRYDFTYTGVTG